MSYNVVLAPSFKHSVRKLQKRFRHVKDDVGVAVRVLVEDLRCQFPVLDPSTFSLFQQKRLLNAFEQVAIRETRSVFEELGLPKPNRDYSNIHPNDVSLDKVLPDRRALDEVVFEALGLTEEEQLEVYRAVVELVKMRLSKAQSVRRRA
jgi:hypothetical protein